MRKALMVTCLCLSASAALAQLQALNVNTGSWEVTEVSSVNASLPPEMQAMLSRLPPAQQEALKQRFGGAPQTNTYKSCITQSDLDRTPFENPDQKCEWTTRSSTGTDMVLRGTCEAGNSGGARANIDMRIHVVDAQNATGTVQLNAASGNGTAVNTNATFTGRWIGPTCEK
jgi:hypothetical protein